MDTTAIESLRAFALAHHEVAFAHLCTEALAQRENPGGELLVMLHDAIARAESCGGSDAHAWEIKERLVELGLATFGVDECGHRSAKADLEDRNPDIERKP